MKTLLHIAIVLSSINLFAQSDFCLSLTEMIKIENQADIPVVSDNGDGTITLTHPDQTITDLFATYTIYSLEQSFPSSTNEELLKFYNLGHGSKALIEDIKSNISENIYDITTDYTSEFPFEDDFISFIDGKQYNYNGYSDGDICGNINTCSLTSFSDDFNLSVLFSYDANSQTLFLETTSPSSCGNEFKIGFKPGFNEGNGGSSAGQIQEWSIENIVSQGNSNDDCFWAESFLYDLLGFTCVQGQYFGNISMFYSADQEKIRFFRENALFFTGIIEFRDPALGIEENCTSLI